MPKYKNGKIYNIYNTITEDIYIGATTQLLSQRMREHRAASKHIIKQNIGLLYKCFNTIGVGNFYIELLETYKCNSKAEVGAKEGKYIRELKPILNSKIEGRTPEEHRELNKEYYELNKDRIKEQKKEYYELNKDRNNEQKKQYYELNNDNNKKQE